MAGLTPLPRTVIHNSNTLTHAQAHNLLSSFLSEAETNPSYRPDAILTQHGPQAAAGIGSSTNLTLTHLNRILQGIEGKRIGGIAFTSTEERPSKRARKMNGMRPTDQVVDGVDGDSAHEPALVGAESDDWQDKAEFEHAQVVETEELPGHNPADVEDDVGKAEGRVDDLEVSSVAGQALTKAEKEARKVAKKARQKMEKKAREEERRGAAG